MHFSSEAYFLASVDIWHPGGFHGNQDNIQYGRHFISAYQSFYMSYSYKAHTYIDINVLRMWSPYMELFNRHPKKGHQLSRSRSYQGQT